MNHWLEGIRVLDFTRLLPGPFATLLLADMGAEVIKVEDTSGGDYARYYPPMVGDSSAFYQSVNRNKQSITLNLKHPEGRDAALTLIDTADVIIESFRPGVMSQLGVGWPQVQDRRPQAVYCAISGYGQTGPLAKRAGHDMNYMALAGLLDQNGKSPVVPGFQVADLAGGALYAALGIVSALLGRTRTGRGAFVDISMTEGALSLGLPMYAMHGAGGTTTPGDGMLTGGIAAYNLYETADGRWLSVGSLEPKFWLGFLGAMDLIELADRGHGNDEQAQQAIAARIREKDLATWMTVFEPLDVCVEPVLTVDETLNHALHAAREVFFSLNGVTHARTPLTPLRAHTPAPSLGEHTDSVLGALGLDVAALRAAGAV